MNTHLIWVWLWFLLGMLSYWLKRAYFLVTGPNPIARSYTQFVERCWAPLLVRALLETMGFWILFTPAIAGRALAYFGWTSYGWMMGAITSVAPIAFLYGHAIDSLADFAVSKIPWLKNTLPQMPGPLPTKSPSDQQIQAQKDMVKA